MKLERDARGKWKRQKRENTPLCPSCGTNDRVQKNGFDFAGTQKFKCVSCGRQFVEFPKYNVKPKEYRPREPKLHTNVCMHANVCKIFPKRDLPSVDSLVGIPCFGCSQQEKCNPNICEKLTEYLMPKLEVIEVSP